MEFKFKVSCQLGEMLILMLFIANLSGLGFYLIGKLDNNNSWIIEKGLIDM